MVARSLVGGAGAGKGCRMTFPDACRHRIGELVFVFFEGGLT